MDRGVSKASRFGTVRQQNIAHTCIIISAAHRVFPCNPTIFQQLIITLFNPCGEFRWIPEGPVSQIHSTHSHDGAPGIFSDLLRSVQMLKREWGAESNGKLPHIFVSSKIAILVPDCNGRSTFGQNCSLGACICSERPALGHNTLMMMNYNTTVDFTAEWLLPIHLGYLNW